MKRSSVRRRNGVGAYHIFLGDLLKKAKTKGKSKAERVKAFRKARAEAARLAKGSVPAAVKARAAARNKQVQAKKTQRRASGGKVSRPSARPSARPAAASSKAGFTGTRKGKGGRLMYFLNGKMVSKAKYMAATGGKASPVKAASKASKGKASKSKGRKGKGKSRPVRTAAAKPAAAGKASKGFTGTRKGAKGRMMYFVGGKMVSAATYKARGGKTSKAVAKASKGKGKGNKPRARKNPSLAGFLDGAKQFGRDAFSVQGILGAAIIGVAHGFVAPRVDAFLTEKAPGRVDVPVLGSVGLNNLSFTATGAVAGASLGGLGYAFGRPTLGLGLGVLAFASGIVLDVVSLVLGKDAEAAGAAEGEDEAAATDMGEIYDDGRTYGEMYNRGVEYGEIYDAVSGGPMTYGDVSLDGSVAPGYGGIMEDGTVVGGGYGAMHNEYADAMAGDAEYSGPDFSAAEGQALLEGSTSWFSKFGRSPKRATGIRGKASRHAGRLGHRWGWLIKLVGMEKASQIAALPPERRLAVIASLRKQAMESLANLLAAQAAGTTTMAPVAAPEQNLLPAPQAMGLDLSSLEGGAMGAGGALGYGNVNVYAGSGF
jgi:hypothetical protein